MPYGRRGRGGVTGGGSCSRIRNPRARQACMRRQETVQQRATGIDRAALGEQQYGASRRDRSDRARSRFGRRFRR